MSHSKYKFKSVGNKKTNRKFDNTNVSKRANIGIKTPIRSTGTTEIFDMHTDFREQLKDNLKNLILTNYGERICRTNFGANLKSLVYDYSKDKQYNDTIKKMILKEAEEKMPAIKITDIQSVVLSDLEKNNANLRGLAKLKLRVVFSIPSARVNNQSVEVEMFIGG